MHPNHPGIHRSRRPRLRHASGPVVRERCCSSPSRSPSFLGWVCLLGGSSRAAARAVQAQTNNHVVSGEQTIEVVLANGSTEQAQLVGTAAADDLAVVRIQPFAHMTVAQIGDSSRLIVGQEVLAIGNPLGITETATQGIVSALNKSVTESTGTTISNAIQTDAAVNPGNSGGALVNLQGQLIGIPTLTAMNTESNTAANGVSFAIPSNLVETVLQQILQQ